MSTAIPSRAAANAGDAIRFATAPCWLGTVLVAASDRGVCAILFGDDDGTLMHDLRQRFADVPLIEADARDRQLLDQAVRFVEAPAPGADLPLDLRGTPFQLRVWQALRSIPAGATASYGEIARRIGAPAMAREVAEACAANPLAVAVPCHRVVRADGTISGYRWGVRRKRALLAREAA